MKIAIVGLSIVTIALLAGVIWLGAPLVSNEAPQGYDMGFIDGCIGAVGTLRPSLPQKPSYQTVWDGCHKLRDKAKEEPLPRAKPPEPVKSHSEELQEHGIEVFTTSWR